jgi:hypothetical protein
VLDHLFHGLDNKKMDDNYDDHNFFNFLNLDTDYAGHRELFYYSQEC